MLIASKLGKEFPGIDEEEDEDEDTDESDDDELEDEDRHSSRGKLSRAAFTFTD